jgi:hypothetical protein
VRAGAAGTQRQGILMKIDHITLTLFAWEDIPATTYGEHTGTFTGRSELGLLTLHTDQGVEGYAGHASAPRSMACRASRKRAANRTAARVS